MISMYDDLAINKWCFPGKLLVLPEGITRTKRFCVVQQPHPDSSVTSNLQAPFLFGSCQCQNYHPKISGMDFFHIIHTLHPLITLLQEIFLGFAKKTPKRVNKNLQSPLKSAENPLKKVNNITFLTNKSSQITLKINL